jgi:regulator of replication initiation timing
MKTKDFIIALLLTICVILACISVQNTMSNESMLLELKNDFRGIFEAHNNLSSRIDKSIQKLDELARQVNELRGEYKATLLDNADIRMENAALRGMIEAFDMEQEGKYDFQGHQSRYIKARKK